ncbi:MAG: hypothetical protein ACIAS6_09265 [Phycisphaerales bacterium JB060]
MDQQPHESPAPSTPPVHPTGQFPAVRSSWPTWLGVLLCVFGGIGLLQRFFGVMFMAAMPLVPQSVLPPEMTVTDTLWVFGLILSIVSLPLSAVHLTAGIQTLRRRSSARFWVLAFVIYAVVILPPGAIYQYIAMQRQMQQAAQQGNSPQAIAALGAGFGLVVGVLSAMVALAWPAFLLIWYSRASIREEVRSWSARGSAA